MSVLQAFNCAGVQRGLAGAEAPLAARAMLEHQIASQPRSAMFLAQVLHESGGLHFFEEIASGAQYEGRADLGNVQPGDGVRYKGRGPIQLTGRANYRSFGRLLNLPLETHPELAARHDVGWRIAAAYWVARGCNPLADANQFIAVTRKINGGTNGLKARLHYLALVTPVDCRPEAPDPLAHLTDRERHWAREYDHLHATGQDPDRRRVLRRVMRVQRKKIYRAANAEPGGWQKLNRIKRYKSLLARTKD
jgi:predicted chitinase